MRNSPAPADVMPPIVVDLGATRKEQVDRLCRGGTSSLADDIAEALRCVRSNAAIAGANRVFVPVVVIYTQPTGGNDDVDA